MCRRVVVEGGGGFMAELLQLIAGSEVRCTDGRVGHVRGLIFDPQARAVTHLSVDGSGENLKGRIVPLGDVQSASPTIQLSCRRADYYGFHGNEVLETALGSHLGLPASPLHVHLVPHGETEIKGHENVHAVDGRAGHLVGVTVDRDSHTVEAILVQVGHFSARHRVSIPFDAVTDVDEELGLHVNLSKDQVAKSNPS
jgi:sporulation protein YlmC with PRC-barrel domain